MDFLRSIALAFSTFSRIPMPRCTWSEQNMRYMLCAFPLVGVVTGAGMMLWHWLCGLLCLGTFMGAAGLLLVPLVITGGIHLDGYCDVCDALASHAEPARKRQILKDPHIGAFAAIWLAVYLVLYVAVLSELELSALAVALLACGQVLSRALSGIASLVFPLSPQKGMLAAQAQPASRTVSLVVLGAFAVLSGVAMIALNVACGAGMILGAALAFLATYCIAKRQFQGMSGDLAGFLVQVSECAMAACLLVVSRVVFLCF